VSEKNSLPLDHLGNWTKAPTFFVDDLMRVGRGIPASFWKFTSVMWRFVVAPGKPRADGKGFTYPYEFTTTLEQLQEYHINREASSKWIAAYSVSGFSDVRYGTRHQFERAATPTVISYRKGATKEDWQAFIGALSNQCRTDREKHWTGNDDRYRWSLLGKLYQARLDLGLSVEHTKDCLARLESYLTGKRVLAADGVRREQAPLNWIQRDEDLALGACEPEEMPENVPPFVFPVGR